MASLVMENAFSDWEIILTSIVLSLLAIFGFLGNLTVCITFIRSKKLQTSANILIVNLAITDTLQCLNTVFMITAVNNVTWFHITGLCQVTAFANVTFIGTSILSLSLISLNRYFVIVKNSNENIFTRRNTLIFTFFVWFIPAVFALSPVLGWCKYQFRPGYLSCLLKFSSSISYTVIFFMTFLLIPFTVMCFCSWKIILTIKGNTKRMEEAASTCRKYKEERRVTIMLFVVILSFLIFYTPISTINIIEVFNGGNYDIASSIQVSIIIITMLNHVNNPIIYGLLNRNYRKAFLGLFWWKKTSENTQVDSCSLEIQFPTKFAQI